MSLKSFSVFPFTRLFTTLLAAGLLSIFIAPSITFANTAILPFAADDDDDIVIGGGQRGDKFDTLTESQLMKAGEKAFRKGELDSAARAFRMIAEKNKLNTKARLRLSHVLLKKRELVEAYYLAYEIAEAEKTNVYAYALTGNILLAAGNFNGARSMLYGALNIKNDDALAIYGLGMLDFYENRLEQSLGKLDRAVYEDPDESDYVLSYAQVAARLEKYAHAAEAYRRFLQIASFSDFDRRDRIRGLIDFLEYLSTKSKLYELAGKNETQLKLEVVNDRPFIKIRTGKNESEELRFVIDTGSNITVISQKTADRLKMKAVARGGKARGIGGDGKFEIVYGFMPYLSMGDIKVRNVPVYIRQFPENISGNDGYIGLALLSKFLTTIDFGSMSMTMSRYENITPTAQPKPLAENEVITNLRLTPSGFLSGEVTMRGVDIPLNFIVDTGAELSVISTELASREGVKGFARNQKMRVIGAAGVTEGVQLFNLPQVSVGAHSVEDVRAIALNLGLINENAGFEQSGILGGNFLKHYRLTFDFNNYTLSFIPIKKAGVAKE